ncbi:MAG: hypothetical protein H6713_27465 [Myxococcales bacterium]|nr:hypothetical protein [Myxococcales bacterium]MCB9753698.1 hypothetical protein [Myxococcales bacterium]
MNEKRAVLIVWIASLIALYLGSGWVETAGRAVLWILLVSHAVECAMNLALFRRAGGSMTNHLVQTMIYGYTYWMPLKRRLAAGE